MFGRMLTATAFNPVWKAVDGENKLTKYGGSRQVQVGIFAGGCVEIHVSQVSLNRNR